jgi:hypothetical protein
MIYGIDTQDPKQVSEHADWLVDILLNGIAKRPR